MRKCGICTNEKRFEIEKSLADNNTLQQITLRFGVSEQSLRTHKRCIAKALQLHEARQTRKSVYIAKEAMNPVVFLEASEKQKFLQNELLNLLKNTSTVSEKAILYQRFLTSTDVENKLTGNYVQDKTKSDYDLQRKKDLAFMQVIMICAAYHFLCGELPSFDEFITKLKEAAEIKNIALTEQDCSVFWQNWLIIIDYVGIMKAS
jgi:hypothetical protein